MALVGKREVKEEGAAAAAILGFYADLRCDKRKGWLRSLASRGGVSSPGVCVEIHRRPCNVLKCY